VGAGVVVYAFYGDGGEDDYRRVAEAPRIDQLREYLQYGRDGRNGHAHSRRGVSSQIQRTCPCHQQQGDLVFVKYLPIKSFETTNKFLKMVKMLHDLRHENVNAFVACYIDGLSPALVLEFCSRGCLMDIYTNENIKLEWSFKLSFLTDVVRGMRYLHSCPLKMHGRLTSRNCVIDSRWVVKITDYGLPTILDGKSVAKATTAKDLLWTAPELLRDTLMMTPHADVYSFAIICQELILRGRPFCMNKLSPEDLIKKLKKPPPLIRPSVSPQQAPPEAIHIMKQCWMEMPESRPSFDAIYDGFKGMNHGKKTNMVDTMFTMLERYSDNLEDIVRERTEQLDEEKKKTDQLLYQMLPRTVADALKAGQPVEAKTYEVATIYFSDIVGFTKLSASSTPMEIVTFLNDLYTMFDNTINQYDVYKVETIGDAYMVVSGIPVPNGDRHVGEIATMSLDILSQCGTFKIWHRQNQPLLIRIGIHTGTCVAGVVGLTMPRYCLFGDTVNTTSRMESTGAAFRIHVSETVVTELDKLGGYHMQYRGEIELKGKGFAKTYWLVGKDGFDKPLPVPPEIQSSLHHASHAPAPPIIIEQPRDADGATVAADAWVSQDMPLHAEKLPPVQEPVSARKAAVNHPAVNSSLLKQPGDQQVSLDATYRCTTGSTSLHGETADIDFGKTMRGHVADVTAAPRDSLPLQQRGNGCRLKSGRVRRDSRRDANTPVYNFTTTESRQMSGEQLQP
ncbi:PREDICTED: retinal guanylyl cyclase 2-like, partial [Priapulus caudatus]|uniref:Guanylate cyclase n=1 Tax=Priapulus caudatus TaxID=37621 RepID=A0ABM1EL15_PRICU